MQILKDIITEDELKALLILASKVCSEKVSVEDEIKQKQLNAIRKKVAQTLTKIDSRAPLAIPVPNDGKPWSKRSGRAKN